MIAGSGPGIVTGTAEVTVVSIWDSNDIHGSPVDAADAWSSTPTTRTTS